MDFKVNINFDWQIIIAYICDIIVYTISIQPKILLITLVKENTQYLFLNTFNILLTTQYLFIYLFDLAMSSMTFPCCKWQDVFFLLLNSILLCVFMCAHIHVCVLMYVCVPFFFFLRGCQNIAVAGLQVKIQSSCLSFLDVGCKCFHHAWFRFCLFIHLVMNRKWCCASVIVKPYATNLRAQASQKRTFWTSKHRYFSLSYLDTCMSLLGQKGREEEGKGAEKNV